MSDWQFYGGAVIGFLELCAIIVTFAAGWDAFFGGTDEERQRGSVIGIVTAGALIVLIQLGHPFFDSIQDDSVQDAITFTASEMHGRTCKQMRDEALARGTRHWICYR